jgi:hypothetical protein
VPELGILGETEPEDIGDIITFSETNAEKYAKSARIQTARQRLADIFDVIEGGKIKDIKYYDDPPLDKPYYKRFYMKPRTFLDTAAGGAGRKRQEAVTDAHSDPAGSSDRNINRIAIEDHLKWVDYPKNKDIGEMTNKEKIDLSMTDDINYNVRGDELGGVEYYKRKLRRGDPIGEPSFTFGTPSRNEGRKRIIGHEGRHRAKALMEEGVKKIPVKVVGYSGGVVEKNLGNRKKLKGAVEYEEGNLKSDKDTRYPILGRYSKSARIQMARERLGAVGKVKRIKLHKDSHGLENAMVKAIQEEYGDFTDMGTLSGSHFLTTDGAVIGSGGDDHRSLVEQAIQRHPDRKLRKMFKDPKMDRTDLMHEFMKQSGLVRINGSSRTNQGQGDMSFSTFHPLSSGQRRFLNSHIENSGMSIDNISFDDMSDDQSVGRQLGLRGEYEDDENAEYAKLRQRIAETGRPKQFNFKETLNKHWKLAAKDPRFKAFTHSSSFVGNVKYDQDEQSMEIILNGKTYDFCNVEERLFDSFSGAGSKGAFFNREIKSLHNCGAW